MPWAARTVCQHPGCGKLVSRPGLCEQHRSEANRAYNAERAGRNVLTDRWYHTSRWQRLRASVLADEPLCRMCMTAGRTTVAVLVDHIRPVRFEGEFFNRRNLQPLCNHCHELKSQAEGSRAPVYLLRGRTAAPPVGGQGRGGGSVSTAARQPERPPSDSDVAEGLPGGGYGVA